MAKLRDEKVSLSVSSLRAYGLNEDLLGEMATMRAGGLTFAPEAGTQRMRDVINKNVTEEHIIESAHRVFSRGCHRMKLYFMIGLPTEDDDDVRGIVETGGARAGDRPPLPAAAAVTRRCRRTCPSRTRRSSGAPWTPRPRPRASSACWPRRRAQLRVDLKMHENQQSHIEGIFSRGDRAVADLLERGVSPRLPLRRLGRRAAHGPVGPGDRGETAARTGLEVGRYLGTIPVTARAAVGPHRHRARGRLPAQGVPQGAEGPPVAAVREAVQEAAAPPTASPTPRRARRQAGLLRLRRRLRPGRDEGRAPVLPAAHERLDEARRAAPMSPREAHPRAARASDAPRRARSRTARRRASRRANRTGFACATPSSGASRTWGTWIWCATCRASFGAPGSSCSIRSGFTPSPSCRSAPRWGWAFRRWASCWT